MKKYILIPLILILALSACKSNQGEPKTNNNTPEEQPYMMGARVKEISALPDANDVAVIVNGSEITKKEIELEKANAEIHGESTVKDAILTLLKEKAVEAEADRLGISYSNDELAQYIEKTKTIINDNEEAAKPLLSYMDGAGFTVDEYLEFLKADYALRLKRAALFEKIISGEISSPGFEYSDDHSTEENVEIYTDMLFESAKIEYIDPDIEKLVK
ncbi:MAG: hypothetical protein Q4B31_01700 [Clostridia bacterium]|nr:hypothetical protein [Clostridia bacterium]